MLLQDACAANAAPPQVFLPPPRQLAPALSYSPCPVVAAPPQLPRVASGTGGTGHRLSSSERITHVWRGETRSGWRDRRCAFASGRWCAFAMTRYRGRGLFGTCRFRQSPRAPCGL